MRQSVEKVYVHKHDWKITAICVLVVIVAIQGALLGGFTFGYFTSRI